MTDTQLLALMVLITGVVMMHAGLTTHDDRAEWLTWLGALATAVAFVAAVAV